MAKSAWEETRTGHGTTNYRREVNGFNLTVTERNREHFGRVVNPEGKTTYRKRYASPEIAKSQLTRHAS